MRKIFLMIAMLATMLFSNSLDEIKAKGEIRIGVWNDQAPFGSYVDGKFEGFEIEMAKTIGNAILSGKGIVTLVGIDNTKQRVEFLQQNKVDAIVASFSMTEERKKLVDFSMPYFTQTLGILAPKTSNIKTLKDLYNIRLAVQSNSPGEDFINQVGRHNFTNLVMVGPTADGYRAVKDGKADAYLNDLLIVLAYPIIDSTVGVPETLRTLGNNDYMGVGVAKGNKELLDEINKQMIKFSKERYFREIYSQTFGVFYRDSIDPGIFLLEDLYRIYGRNTNIKMAYLDF
ncbi:MAG: transporter substrate-binding domain-containing protein [Campylobacter sp.]|nr:transporter substrate-binding domain-containing protein [Campylobacter sp.]